MSIVIRVGEKANEKKVKLELNLRKGINGDLLIFDHGDIDIVLSPAKSKIVVFPKDAAADLVYGAQNRLFSFLYKKGIVIPESIKSGAFFGSLEGALEKPVSEDVSAAKLALINISNFIAEERPYFENTEAIISMTDDELIHPEKADSTDLGDVPQSVEQGSIRHGIIRDPYSLNYMYTLY